MLEQMQAMKLQDDREAARTQQHTDNNYRPHNHHDSTNNTPAQAMLTPTKRQRVNMANNSKQNDMMIEDTQMACLVKQASQQL
jgi:hypothetical protein